MNNDLIFSIGQIFSIDPEEGVLGINNTSSYYIAPYQRGYKWSSVTENDPVCILMKDLREAFENRTEEYYLQYITTKKNQHEGDDVLEVIDGQQRLTTLSILFCVLAEVLEKSEVNITLDKLRYEVRPKVSQFFIEFIYNNIQIVIEDNWPDFINKNPSYDEQDIYYLYHAAKSIHNHIKSLEGADHSVIFNFSAYIRDRVKIIVNNVKGNISCEKIFSNLNTNKVELTEAELIKGLFLTKVARESNDAIGNSYKELLELRTVLGRQWDEVSTWANRPEIASFYFNKSTSPINDLLKLVAIKNEFHPPEQPQKNLLFNYFHSAIKKPETSATYFFHEILKIQKVLKDWFKNDTIYNCLGYLSINKSKKFQISDYLKDLELPTSTVESNMSQRAAALIPDQADMLDYTDSKEKIHCALQALSIFNRNNRFDFHGFSAANWSLEHIYPQNHEHLPDTITSKDIQLINSLLKKRMDNPEWLRQRLGKLFTVTRYNTIKKKLSRTSCTLLPDEKMFIYEAMKTDMLNSIGNMALLTDSDNSSNSNGMFDSKRNNMVKRISLGSFVPKHTYDVFSKLLSNRMSPDLSIWTEADIQAHQEWIMNKLTEIKTKQLSAL